MREAAQAALKFRFPPSYTELVMRHGAPAIERGSRAPSRISRSEDPAQLLEYHHAFGVDGVLLVDADARRIRLVELRRPRAARRSLAWLFVVGVLVLAVCTALASARAHRGHLVNGSFRCTLDHA